MPIHFETLGISEDDAADILSSLIEYIEENAKHVFATPDTKYIHLTGECYNEEGKSVLGVVMSLQVLEDYIKILDIDVTSVHASKTKMSFDYRIGDREGGSYYDVMDDKGRHFEIETINRGVIEGHLIGNRFDVSMTAFPFDVDLFDTIEELNEEKGLGSVKLNDHFTAPSSLFGDNEVYTYVIGRVTKVERHLVHFGDANIDIYVLKVMVGSSELTVITSADSLPRVPKADDVIEMSAYISADLSTKENSYYNK